MDKYELICLNYQVFWSEFFLQNLQLQGMHKLSKKYIVRNCNTFVQLQGMHKLSKKYIGRNCNTFVQLQGMHKLSKKYIVRNCKTITDLNCA